MSLTHLYFGNSFGVAGTINNPTDQSIAGHAPAVVPVNGGNFVNEMPSYDYPGVVSCGKVRNSATGTLSDAEGAHNTVTTSVVEDLNILDVIYIERLVSRVTVHQPRGSKHPRTFTSFGTTFENMTIAGQPVHIEYHHECFTPKTYQQLAADLSERSKIASSAPHRTVETLDLTGESVYRGTEISQNICEVCKHYDECFCKEMQSEEGPIFFASVVKNVTLPHGLKPVDCDPCVPGYKLPPHVIAIDGVGMLYLGELLLRPFSQRLTMIRLEMGCATEGTMTAGDAFSGGCCVPPYGRC